MKHVYRILGVVVIGHGLLHLMGAAQGLGWSRNPMLSEPISTGWGASWLVAAVLLVAAGLALIVSAPWWWLVGVAAAVVSQIVIIDSWNDARVGTVVNVLLLAAAGYGYAAEGPRSLRAEFRHRASAALLQPAEDGVVTERDLAALPSLVAAYVRQSGAVGQPRIRNFRATVHGRIRSAETAPWMAFTGKQVNTCGPSPSRLFFLDARMRGIPVDVLHVFVGDSATMRVKAASLLTMVDAAGPQMDRAETVTLFNDLCILAPAALIGAGVSWTEVDAHRVRGTFVRGRHSVSAELVFNDAHELVDFVSDDRLALSSDGSTFTAQRWSTPMSRYEESGARRLAVQGEARWDDPALGHPFTYLDLTIDEIEYNLAIPARA